MNNEIHHRLAAAFARYGLDPVIELRRTEALVRDVCAGAALERNVLIAALRAGVPVELQGARGADQAALVERLARRLQGEHALDPGAARWAVETWAKLVCAMRMVGAAEPPEATGEAPEAAEQYEDAVRAFTADGVLENWEGEELAHLRRELGISAATHAALLAKYQPGPETWPIRLELDDALRRGFTAGIQGAIRARVSNDGTRALKSIVVRHAVVGVPGVHEHTVSLLGPGRGEAFTMLVQVPRPGRSVLEVILSARDMLGKGQSYRAEQQTFRVGEGAGVSPDVTIRNDTIVDAGSADRRESTESDAPHWHGVGLSLMTPDAWEAWALDRAKGGRGGPVPASRDGLEVALRVEAEAAGRARVAATQRLRIDDAEDPTKVEHVVRRRVAEEAARKRALRPAWQQVWMTSHGRDARGIFVTTSLGGVSVLFRWCPPGTFWRGTRLKDGGDNNERPCHKVQFTRGWWLAETPVTQMLWQAVMHFNPSMVKGWDLPVGVVTWHDCQRFLSKANTLQPGLSARLPTEAEWEYACRAGTTGSTWLGANDAATLDQIAWHRWNSGRGPMPVKTKAENPWGLYDMLGNVWEWCADWFGPYRDAHAVDPLGPAAGPGRVRRGGSSDCHAVNMTAARREWAVTDHRHPHLGFRIAVSSMVEPAAHSNNGLFGAP